MQPQVNPELPSSAPVAKEIRLNEERSTRQVLLLGYWFTAILLVGDLLFGQPLVFTHKSLLKIASVGREDGLPNWVASVLLTSCSLFCLLVAQLQGRLGAPKGEVRKWIVLFGFLFLGAMDMGAGVHQRVGYALRDFADHYLVGAGPRLSVLLNLLANHRWQVLMLPFYVAGTVYFYDFFKTRERTEKNLRYLMFSLSSFSFGLLLNYLELRVGAISNGNYLGMPIDNYRHYLDLGQAAAKLGGAVFLFAFLVGYLHRTVPGFEIEVSKEPSP